MTCQLQALGFDALDPEGLARFWAAVLGWEPPDGAGAASGGVVLRPDDDIGLRIHFRPTRQAKTGRNLVHFDLTSASPDDQRRTVERALGLGGRHYDVGQRPEEGHVVLADPEGNEFCVVEPGNAFLAGCGVIGALSGDGSQQVGYFWSAALDWPLVWDQDEETAIRSPRGGSKITWGGPPLMPRPARNRLRLELDPPADGDRRAEVDRLLALGAKRLDIGPDDVGQVVLADPDGNEFWVLAPQ